MHIIVSSLWGNTVCLREHECITAGDSMWDLVSSMPGSNPSWAWFSRIIHWYCWSGPLGKRGLFYVKSTKPGICLLCSQWAHWVLRRTLQVIDGAWSSPSLKAGEETWMVNNPLNRLITFKLETHKNFKSSAVLYGCRHHLDTSGGFYFHCTGMSSWVLIMCVSI